MENLTLTWTKLTKLSSENIDKIKDNSSGVYRLSYEADDSNYYVFYVGQAERKNYRKTVKSTNYY